MITALLIADASNAAVGQWINIATGVLGGIGGLAAVASWFATRRELESIAERVKASEVDIVAIRQDAKNDLTELLKAGEERAEKLHIRMNPIATNTAEMKGQMSAFTQSFDNFTQLITALHRKRKSEDEES